MYRAQDLPEFVAIVKEIVPTFKNVTQLSAATTEATIALLAHIIDMTSLNP